MMKTILVDAVNTFVIKEKGVFASMYELLETYPNRKIILTNANDEQMETFGLNDVPYDVFTLKHNPDKIDSDYYTQMLEHFNVSADEVIYFEHNLDAVKSAESVSIMSYHYDSEKKDLDALKEFVDTHIK